MIFQIPSCSKDYWIARLRSIGVLSGSESESLEP